MKAPGTRTASSPGSSEPCALLGATASKPALNPVARSPPNWRGPGFPETLSRNSPHGHGHFAARHSHEPSQAAALLRAKGRQRSAWPADFCRPQRNPAARGGCAEGKELVPYTDCFNSVTFMYWKLKPERCF